MNLKLIFLFVIIVSIISCKQQGFEADSSSSQIPNSISDANNDSANQTNSISIRYSLLSDRSQARELSNANINQDSIYIFVNSSKSNITKIDFYLDDKLVQTDNSYPYDMAGSLNLNTAKAFDLSQLQNGQHKLKVVINGDALYSDAVSFTKIVDNNTNTGWTIIRDFNDGVIGEKIDVDAGGNSRYSDVVAFEGGQSSQMGIAKGETGYGVWGAGLNHPTDLKEGDELWFRVYTYFPSGFDYFSYGEGGRLKFLRFHTADSSGNNLGYNDIYIDSKDSNNSFSYIYEGEQIWKTIADKSLRPYFDVWESYEFYVKFHHKSKDDGGEAVVRFWKNGKLIKEITDRKTLVSSTDYSDLTYLFTYWNGGSPKTQHMWVDNLVLTSQTPSSRDDYGNPYIGTTIYSEK